MTSLVKTYNNKKPTKVLFFGTHPSCYNGYCIVTYNLAKELAIRNDITMTLYAFQNFYSNAAHNKERELPPNVYIYDASANENPKSLGFGFDQVPSVVSGIEPDVCVIYNDMVVVSNIISKLVSIPDRKFKIIVYIDQVYLYQKAEYIKLLNEHSDYVLCFTPYWEGIAKEIGITKPTGFLRHGFDPYVHYPIPKHLARQHFGLKQEDFIIMNLNRNQPRKRWDVCLTAFAEVVSRHSDEPIKLLIATALNGAWNLLEIYERELKKRGVSLEEGMKHIIVIDNPQQLTDEDVNILYNVANIGINTCDGEGFGLCNFQQAAIGIPQIVPKIGGFLDFFTEDRSSLILPKFNLYIDSGRDGVGGESQICEWMDFADAIDVMYGNKEDAIKKAEEARKYIIENYKWKDIGDKFYDIVRELCPVPVPGEVEESVSLDQLEKWDKELGSKKETKVVAKTKKVVKKKEQPIPQDINKKLEETKARLKNKIKDKKEKDELLALKEQIDKLLSEKETEKTKTVKKTTTKTTKKKE